MPFSRKCGGLSSLPAQPQAKLPCKMPLLHEHLTMLLLRCCCTASSCLGCTTEHAGSGKIAVGSVILTKHYSHCAVLTRSAPCRCAAFCRTSPPCTDAACSCVVVHQHARAIWAPCSSIWTVSTHTHTLVWCCRTVFDASSACAATLSFDKHCHAAAPHHLLWNAAGVGVVVQQHAEQEGYPSIQHKLFIHGLPETVVSQP